MKPRAPASRWTAVSLTALALAGCTSIGDPDPHALLPPNAGAGAPLRPARPGLAPQQTFAIGQATPAGWWRAFGCAPLDALEAQALTANNDLAAADAALRQARALAGVAAGALGPAVDLGYSAQRARTSEALSPPVTDSNQLLYSLHTAQVTVNYPVDLFGELHARRRSAIASAKAAAARLLAARQTVAANLVVAAITRAELADQIAATRTGLAAARETLALSRRRRDLGASGDADVAAQEAALAATEGSLPALERAEAHQQAVIAALLGRAPGIALPPLPESACFALPVTVPVAEPADVVRHRPDVMAAAAAVEGAAADAHAAVAARFPSLTLSGAGGGASQNFGDMFRDANLFWSVLGGITAPLFHAGALHHQQEAALAALDQSKAQYRAAVIQAFVDVNDALNGLYGDAAVLAAADRALAAAERSAEFVRRQQQLGDVGTFSVLSAQAALQQARIQTVAARAAWLTDTVALYQANGVGETQ